MMTAARTIIILVALLNKNPNSTIFKIIEPTTDYQHTRYLSPTQPDGTWNRATHYKQRSRMSDPTHYFSEDMDYSDMFEGGEENSYQKEELNEGGDYHLQSALKSAQDYRKDFIYDKEEKKLDSIAPRDARELTSIQTIFLFWKLACRKTPLSCNHIVGDLHRFQLLVDDDYTVSKFTAVELKTLYDIPVKDMLVYKENLYSLLRTFRKTYPNMAIMVHVICLILILKNNLKNMRVKDIQSFEGMASFWVVEGVGILRADDEIMVYFTTDVMMMEVGSERMKFPIPYFLQAADKVQERYNVMIYSLIVHPLMPLVTPNIVSVLQIIEIGDNLLDLLGNPGYDTIASYEALVVGVILERDDKDLLDDPPSFLRAVLNDLPPEGRKSGDLWVKLFRGLSIDQLSDIHGIYRIWGHPVIDIDGGIKKMMDVSLKKKVTDRELGAQVSRKFKEIFYTNYKKLNGFYPPYSLRNGQGEDNKLTYLEDCLESGRLFSPKNSAYNLNQWDRVISGKCFEIPYSWNILHTVKDKAISPNREELCDNLLLRGHVFNMNHRRVVLKTVSTPMKPMREFLCDVAQNSLPDKFCIIGIYPKEREIKIKPRFFSLMSHELRLYITSTEELANDKLLRYFPQITMSLNLLEMQKKMGKMSENMGVPGSSVVYIINMDFVKWNQQMRYDICEGVFKEIDQLFQVEGLYNNTHKIFEKCTIFLSSGERKLLPDRTWGVVIDNVYSWTGDGSGKEGLRQKPWTIMTDCDIALVADEEGVEFSLVGGGDNQVLRLVFRSTNVDDKGNITEVGKRHIRGKLNHFLEALKKHFDRRGLPLKSSETWVSSGLFMYNKHMYHKGRPLRSVLKQISRCFPFANSSLMSASLMCNSVSTILKAAMQKEIFCIGVLTMRSLWGSFISRFAYSFNPLFLTTEGSLRSGRFSVCRERTRVSVKMLEEDRDLMWLVFCCLPSVLGGPGLSNCFNIIMRGFPDSLTEGIMYLRLMEENCGLIDIRWKNRIRKMRGVSMSILPKFEKLVEDPTSLSHDAPSHSTTMMREAAREAVIGLAGGINREFVELMNIADRNKESVFYSALCSAEELDPKVYHELAKASLYGFTNSLLSRIDKTKTVLRMNETIKVVTDIAASEYAYLGYLAVRDKLEHDVTFSQCSRLDAERSRTVSYCKRVLGVTVPHPVEYLQVTEVGHHHCGGGSINIRWDGINWEEGMRCTGPCKPYYGSYTKERFKATEVAAAYGDEDILKRVASIQKMIGWRYDSASMMGQLIRGAFMAVTNTDPEMLWVDENTIRGSYDHRRNVDSNTHGGIPNFIITPSTHLSICTSTWFEHSRSGKNETIHFQACIISCVIKMMQKMMCHLPGKVVEFHAHECCPNCITPLDEISATRTSPASPVDFPTCPGNSLVYMHSENVKMDYSRMVAIQERRALLSCEGIQQVTFEYDWSDYNEAVDCISTILVLSSMGYKTSVPKSFLLLARDKVNVVQVLSLFKIKWATCKQLARGNLVLRNHGAIDLLCDYPGGYAAKYQSLGWGSSGKLEGDTSCDFADDGWGASGYCFGSVINPVIGCVSLQMVISIAGRYQFIRNCPLCSNELWRVSTKPFSEARRLCLCVNHQTVKIHYPVLPNHPDNILKSATEGTRLVDIFHSRDEGKMMRYKNRGDQSSEREMLPVGILSSYSESVEVAPWTTALVCVLKGRDNCTVWISDDLFYINIVEEAVRRVPSVRIIVHVVLKELSYSETGIIYEKVPLSTGGPNVPGRAMYSPKYTLEGMSKTDVVIIGNITECAGALYTSGSTWITGLSSMYLLDEKYYRKVHYLDIPVPGAYPSAVVVGHFERETLAYVNYTMLNDISLEINSAFHLWPSKEDPDTRAYVGGAGMKKHIAQFKFFNRLEWIMVTERALRKIRSYDRFERKKSKSDYVMRILTLYVVSVLCHTGLDETELVGKIRSISYHPLTGKITIKLKEAGGNNEATRFYIMMRSSMIRTGRDYLLIDKHTMLTHGINTTGQRKRGLNVSGV